MVITWPINRLYKQEKILAPPDANVDKVTLGAPNYAPDTITGGCIICKSKRMKPLMPITNSPLELGIWLSREGFTKLEEWTSRRRNKEQYTAGSRASFATSFKTVHSDTSWWSDSQKDDEMEVVWTMWLVPFSNVKGNGDDTFRIKIHIVPIPKLSSVRPDRLVSHYNRNVWLCIGKTSQTDWDVLRVKCLDGKHVSYELVDASGTFQLPVNMSALHKVGKMSFIKKRWSKFEPSEMEKRVEVRLCTVEKTQRMLEERRKKTGRDSNNTDKRATKEMAMEEYINADDSSEKDSATYVNSMFITFTQILRSKNKDLDPLRRDAFAAVFRRIGEKEDHTADPQTRDPRYHRPLSDREYHWNKTAAISEGYGEQEAERNAANRRTNKVDSVLECMQEFGQEILRDEEWRAQGGLKQRRRDMDEAYGRYRRDDAVKEGNDGKECVGDKFEVRTAEAEADWDDGETLVGDYEQYDF